MCGCSEPSDDFEDGKKQRRVTEIEHASQPLIIVSTQMDVFSNPHDASIR